MDVLARMVFDTGESTRVGVIGDVVDANMRVTMMTVLEFITLSPLSKEFLLSSRTKFCSCPMIVSECCALQTWMPSDHVC